MGDLTREQIEACRTRASGVHGYTLQALCTMALRALDADDEIATLRAALLARGIEAPAYYTRTDAERAADAQIHARRITRGEAEWMTFSARAHHEAQKPCADVPRG